MTERTLRQRLPRGVHPLPRPNRLSGSQGFLSVMRMVLVGSVGIKSSLEHIPWEPAATTTLPTEEHT